MFFRRDIAKLTLRRDGLFRDLLSMVSELSTRLQSLSVCYFLRPLDSYGRCT